MARCNNDACHVVVTLITIELALPVINMCFGDDNLSLRGKNVGHCTAMEIGSFIGVMQIWLGMEMTVDNINTV